uniref:Uncharacterized protein TCIL3000_11_7530 n=1 Tax=Trypanosoma congolense (strain IL3000) TaxID=1068625 RepID=G0V0Z6_TRYCI|nr:unnamed protein product [Trypanosoma congolense IL3000]
MDTTSVSQGESDCGPFSSELLVTLDKRAAVTLSELNRAVKAHQENRVSRTHEALVLSISAAQRVIKLLTEVDEHMQRQKKQSSERHLPALHITLLAQLDTHRAAIRRALPAAVAAVEAGGEESAAETASALRSLMYTRSILNMELRKVQGAVDELRGSSKSLEVLHTALQDVNATVELAHRMVGKLLSIKTVDDALLRVSVVVFILVLVYIVAQRVFGYFPTVYKR